MKRTLGICIAIPLIGTLCALGALRAAEPPSANAPAGPVAGVYDARGFGARGDGTTVDSPAIDRAIAAASAVGGGVVRLTAGTYLCATIHLKSHITLEIGPGATIRSASNGFDPPEPNEFKQYQDFGHSHWHNSLIEGENLEDVSIIGPGRIDGHGLSRGAGADPPPGVGNKSIALKLCHNVTLRGFQILQGGHFGILATAVDNLTIEDLKIDTNRDGMDVDACRNVRISNCSVNSPGDDGICLKSSFGLGFARATENVTISDCYVTGSYRIGTLLDGTYVPFGSGERVGRTGRIKLGTESNGGFKKIAITNCVFDGGHGLALETVDGGDLEDVTISNLTMHDIVGPAIFLRLGSRQRAPEGTPVGHLRRVHISDVTIYHPDSHYACLLAGIPGHALEDITLTGIHLVHPGGGTAEEAARAVPEREKAYPEAEMLGHLPAWGFYIRHVDGLILSDCDLKLSSPDARPVFDLDDVQNADLRSLLVPAPPNAAVGTVRLHGVANIRTEGVRGVVDTRVDKADAKSL